MVVNTGKSSEQTFQDAFARLGKKAFVHRLVDASEIKGRTGKIATSARAQPSDYIVSCQGLTFFAEVKSTQNEKSFPFSILNKNQSAKAKMILGAGGQYWVFVHELARNRWYQVPYNTIEQVKQAGKSSIKWDILQPLRWTLPDALL